MLSSIRVSLLICDSPRATIWRWPIVPHGPHADPGVLRRAGDLMNAERLHDSIATVRTQIEDLQAEVEAGARCVDRIQSDVKIIDGRTINYFRQSARMTALLQCAEEL